MVGSFDAWLAKPAYLGASNLRDSPAWVWENEEKTTTQLTACSASSTVVSLDFVLKSANPRLSLLTAQLRQSQTQSAEDETARGVGCSEPSLKSPLSRANSHPALHQGSQTNDVELPERDALSSPFEYAMVAPHSQQATGQAGAALCLELALEDALVSMPEATPEHEAATWMRWCGHVGHAAGSGASLMSPLSRRSSSGSSCHSSCSSTRACKDEQEQDLRSLSATVYSNAIAEVAGARTSQKRNAYEGTVRGGHPLHAAVLPVRAAPPRQQGGPDTPPRSLAEMLQSALQRA